MCAYKCVSPQCYQEVYAHDEVAPTSHHASRNLPVPPSQFNTALPPLLALPLFRPVKQAARI
jgi:hypothetical protein